jgi:hypothetical protein
MGLFSKARTGEIDTVTVGRVFIWRIPRITSTRFNTVLDSELLTSFEGVEFHFHLIVGARGDLGFYVHHKREKIPKYSFYFQPQGSETRLRQHTAHTIPPDTERCGHWNVCNIQDLARILPNPDAALEIHFTFDTDFLHQQPVHEEGAKEFTWLLPNPTAHNLSPFTSTSFAFNGVYYVMRLDKQHDGSYVAFVYSRTGLVPPHSIGLADGKTSEVLCSLPKTEDMTTQLLKIPREAMERARVSLQVVMHRGGNPLDVLNNPRANLDDQADAKTVHEDDVRSKKYGIAMEDI